MSNIIDKIRVSGTDYTLSATSSGGNPTIEVTQAEYDALVSAGTVQEDTYYIITDSSIDYINSAQCQSQIDSSISGKADTSAVTEAIDAAVSGKVSTNDFNAYSGAVDTEIGSKASQSDLNSLSGTVTGHTANTTIHVTSSEKQVWNAKSDFSGSYNDLTNKPTIPTSASQLTNDSGYITSGDAQSQIDSSISGKVDTSTYTAYTSTTATEIGGKASQSDLNSLSGTVTGHTANTAIHVTSSEKTTWSGKQDALVSGTNIKTINNESILGSGNITIQSEVSSAITSGDTNAVAGGAIYDKFDEVEQVTAAALNDINDRVSEDKEVTAAALNALNTNKQDKLSAGTGISISGNVISATGGGGGNPTVELTQAEYDALVSAGTVSADTYYIITDATPVDMSNYYTSAQTNTLLAGKQDTLSAGTGIEISGNVISATGGGSSNLPISAGTGTNSVIVNSNANKASGSYSHAEGSSTKAYGTYSHAEGINTRANGSISHAEGDSTQANGETSHAEGHFTNATNESEHASGRYNVSSKASTTFGDSGNTLFSVGNGEDSEYRHNALDIRQNGDIYIVDTSASGDYYDKPMIKLQESLGGTVSSAITRGDTNAVAGGAVYNRFDEVEQVTAQALNVLNESLNGKQDTLSAGTNITIVDNVISAEGGSITIDPSLDSGSTNPVANSAITKGFNDYTIKTNSDNGEVRYYYWASPNYPYGSTTVIRNFSINGRCPLTQTNGSNSYIDKFNLVETSAITSAVTSSSTDAQVPSAKCLYDAIGDIETLLSQI